MISRARKYSDVKPGEIWERYFNDASYNEMVLVLSVNHDLQFVRTLSLEDHQFFEWYSLYDPFLNVWRCLAKSS